MTTSRGSMGTRAGGSGRPRSHSTESSGAEAIRDFVEDVRDIIEEELHVAQEELAGKFRVASEGALVLGVAVVLGGLAAGTSTVVILRMLEKVLPPTVAATVATVVFAIAAGVLATVGIAAVRRALPLIPERALEELREEVREVLPG
ncbi:phage holin family protein [Pseudonocardia alaniniphila]|uniref:Phage holin family protein n=1 Tax=Pseudonocardia alaniniphila TaxID=75291 RepID=A0ABS9TQS7_9PSEU|nr:phage holin family protein [Pseudonocardia alaniniphila]MCH6170894.1 phage holin family protein [Pseudonocardia alaniniphila]